MKLPQLTYCCCGCSLTMGSLIIGFVEAVYALLTLIGSIFLSVEVDKWSAGTDYKDAAFAAYVTLAVTSGIHLTIAVCLLSGIFMAKHGLFIPWLVYAGVDASLAVILGILNSVIYFATSTALIAGIQITIIIVYLFLKVYFFLVVYSLFRVLKREVFGSGTYPGSMEAQPY